MSNVEWFEEQKDRNPAIGFLPLSGDWYAEIVANRDGIKTRITANGKTMQEAIASLRMKLDLFSIRARVEIEL